MSSFILVKKSHAHCGFIATQCTVRQLKKVKLGFSEKATKFEKIFVVLLTRVSCSVRATAYLSKSRRRFFKTNVVKSYYTNFKLAID